MVTINKEVFTKLYHIRSTEAGEEGRIAFKHKFLYKGSSFVVSYVFIFCIRIVEIVARLKCLDTRHSYLYMKVVRFAKNCYTNIQQFLVGVRRTMSFFGYKNDESLLVTKK